MTSITHRPLSIKDRKPWPGPSMDGDRLPDRLIYGERVDWHKITWDFPDDRTGVYPDTVSKFNNDSGAWSGFVVRNGAAYAYAMIWYRNRDTVILDFTRRNKNLGSITLSLTQFFAQDEPLVAGETTVAHIQDHLNPDSLVLDAEGRTEDEYVNEMGAAYPDIETARIDFDGEYRFGAHIIMLAFEQVLLVSAETEAGGVQAKADLVPSDGSGMTDRELADLWSVGIRQVERIVAQGITAGLLRSEEEPAPGGGRPRKRVWGTEPEA